MSCLAGIKLNAWGRLGHSKRDVLLSGYVAVDVVTGTSKVSQRTYDTAHTRSIDAFRAGGCEGAMSHVVCHEAVVIAADDATECVLGCDVGGDVAVGNGSGMAHIEGITNDATHLFVSYDSAVEG